MRKSPPLTAGTTWRWSTAITRRPQGLRFTISEAARREVLTRLLKLNHERFAEECRQGLHTTKKGKKACAEFFEKNPQQLAASQSPDAVGYNQSARQDKTL